MFYLFFKHKSEASKTTIKSHVNGRQFSLINYMDKE